METAEIYFDLTPSPFCSVEFLETVGFISSDPRWGGFTSLQMTDDGLGWVAVTDGGRIAIQSWMQASDDPQAVTMVELVDDTTGSPLFVDSVTTISGSPLFEPLMAGAYVRVNSAQSPVRLYNSHDTKTYKGSVFERGFEDPLSLCPEALRQDVSSCVSGSGGQTLTSIPAESGQDSGSLLFLCESRSEMDQLFHGWACNPSTGDSWRFSFDGEPGWQFADWTFCKNCEPGQVFLLSYNDTSFAVDTVLLSALDNDDGKILLADDLVHGRVRLFHSSRSGDVRALSVASTPYYPNKLRVDIGTRVASSGLTQIHTFSLELSPAAKATLQELDSRASKSLSLIVLAVLVLLGIALPLVVMRKPLLRRRLEELFRGGSPKPMFASLETEDPSRMKGHRGKHPALSVVVE